ncbi:polyketide synthase [Whalleya microplaca]|nr:polyketide synthase [Whalleya microplaca]
MPAVFPVFAGLGSPSLFSDETVHGAAQDALMPECAVLLQLCHRTFHTQIFEAIGRGIIAASVINLDDFNEPVTLARPPAHYSRNVLVQHTTLYLQQMLRYIAHPHDREELVGAAGFSAGLLPAAAVAAAGGSSILTLISCAYDFFQVALWLGIRSEAYQREQLSNFLGPRTCSYVVDGITHGEAIELINEAKTGGNVFVSAVLSPTRLTLSGKPTEIASFVLERLPAQYRSKSTEVFSLYHNRHLLKDVRDQVFRDLGRCGALLQTKFQFATPLLSSATGEVLSFSARPSFEEVASELLDMILLEPIDWVAVQNSIAVLTNEHGGAGIVSILNYGPGVGASPTALRYVVGQHVEIIDASRPGKRSSTETSRSKLDLDDIAIVGMAVDLPGAPDKNILWERLMQGVNSCSEIPASRFNVNDYNEASEAGRKKGSRVLGTRYGNFLENPYLFDPELFGISRREALSMDPQQRILLQTAYRALEDAGYVPDSSPSCTRDTFGCWIGNATLDYVDNLRDDIDVYYSTGTLRTFLSARISYVFGWSGPSITLDTACSSSTVALHQAARSILAGDCRAALVGAANTMTSPNMYLGLDRAHFLSPSGQCKAFDTSADGYCRAEGCGVFIIKKLSDALAEGDRVHAVIKAVEINQSGTTHSITHPHVPTQETLFKKMFRDASINPHDVSVVEMHGTGTQAGDPNEVESVRRVLCKDRSAQNLLHLTSIKANIGHAEAVSGIAGLAKIVLMMHHGRIPPQISLKNLNPRIRQLGIDGAVIDRDGAEWTRPARGIARIGMLNNFGAGGSNAAVLIAEHIPPSEKLPPAASPTSTVCGFSAKTQRALSKLQETLVEYLAAAQEGPRAPLLADVCATLTSRRQLYDHRIAVSADSLGDLAEKIRKATARNISDSLGSKPEAVFVFSGQGSQYLGMGRELMHLYSVFAETVNNCERWLVENNYPSCLQVIQGDINDAADTKTDAKMWEAFQSAMFVLEVGLVRLLMSWGITPSAVVGHSLGEYAALVTAGVISMSDGLKLVAHRARLTMQQCKLGETSMLAVNCGASAMQELIDTNDDFAGLVIACSNSYTDCVVGGLAPQLSVLKGHLAEAKKAKSKLLDVPLAFHTQAMDPILTEFNEFAAREVQVSVPKIPVISNVLGRTVLAGEQAFSPEYFAKQCRNTVAFSDGIRDFLTNSDVGGTTVRWIEVGPHPVIQPMLRGMLKDAATPQTLLPVVMKGVSPSDTVARILCHFYETSSGMNWRKVLSQGVNASPKLIDLPGMPFFQAEFHVPYRELAAAKKEQPDSSMPIDIVANSFAVRRIQRLSHGTTNTCAIYDTPAISLKKFIEGHIVCGHALCPASVYHEMALAALRDAEPEASSSAVWALAKVSYSAPFVYDDALEQVMRAEIRPRTTAPHGYDFTVSSYVSGSSPGTHTTTHCHGIIKHKSESSVRAKYARLQASVNGKVESLRLAAKGQLDGTSPHSVLHQQVFSRSAIYDKIFTRVVTYSELYQKVQSIRIDDQAGEAVASCTFLQPHVGGSGTIPAANAVFMDVLLHVAGFVANLKLESDVMGICKEVGAATVFRTPAGTEASHRPFNVYCSTFDIQEGHGGTLTIADAYALDSEGVLAVYKGMVFQHVKMTSIDRALGMANRSSRKHVTQAPSSTSRGANHEALTSKAVPSLAAAAANATKPSSSTSSSQVRVGDLIAKTCGLIPDELGPETRLDALGVDSLMMIELEAEILSAFGTHLSGDAMDACTTVRDIERLCNVPSPRIEHPAEDADTPTTVSSFVSGTTSPAIPASISTVDSTIDITEIIAEICGAEPGTVSLDSELTSLGMDSLMSLEFEDRLSDIYGSEAVSSLQLQECSTVMDVESLIEQQCKRRISQATQATDIANLVEARVTPLHQAQQPPRASSLLHPSETAMFPVISKLLQLDRQPELIQAGQHKQQQQQHRRDNASPLFLVHDGSGICTHYRRLQSLHRQVFAIHDPKFLSSSEDDALWSSLPAMAAHYASIVSSATEANGDCILGGWSFGGVVAFEAARILMSQGELRVKGVVLIDSPPPVGHIPLSDSIIHAVTTSIQGTVSSASSSRRFSNDTNNTQRLLTPAAVIRKLVRQSFQKCANLLGAYGAAPETRNPERPIPRVILLRSAAGWTPPLGYDGPPIGESENPWLQDRADRSLGTAGWEMLTGTSLPCIDIPGNHFQVFDAVNVEAVSKTLWRACLDLD